MIAIFQTSQKVKPDPVLPQCFAGLINRFNQSHLVPYLNFHRPCFFPTVLIDKKGKEKKQYKYRDLMTPYEKLKSLPDAQGYLKEGVSFEILDRQAVAKERERNGVRLDLLTYFRFSPILFLWHANHASTIPAVSIM